MSARARAKLISRGRPATPTLLCPLLVEQAAEVGAVPIDELKRNPTLLANGLRALHTALGSDVIATSVGDLADATDPVIVDTAVEATRRLVATEREAAVAGVLPGPASGVDLLPVARRYLDAGAHLLILVEPALPEDPDAWRQSVTTIANVARFHQAAPVLVLGSADAVGMVPRGVLVCVPNPGPGQGIALPVEPAGWSRTSPTAPLAVTLGATLGSFGDVAAAMGRLTP